MTNIGGQERKFSEPWHDRSPTKNHFRIPGNGIAHNFVDQVEVGARWINLVGAIFRIYDTGRDYHWVLTADTGYKVIAQEVFFSNHFFHIGNPIVPSISLPFVLTHPGNNSSEWLYRTSFTSAI